MVLLLRRVARLEEAPRLAVVVEALEELPQLGQRLSLPRGTRREVVVVDIDPRVPALLRRARCCTTCLSAAASPATAPATASARSRWLRGTGPGPCRAQLRQGLPLAARRRSPQSYHCSPTPQSCR